MSVVLVLGLSLAAPGSASAQGQMAPVATAGPPVPAPLLRMPAMEVPSAITPVRYQGGLGAPAGGEGQSAYQIQLEPPGLWRIAQSMENDARLQERIRQEVLSNPATATERVDFPGEPILSRDRYAGRGPLWMQRGLIVEPNFVNYRKLFFEDKNAERYGWDFGGLQVPLSYGLFFWDTLLLPMHAFNDPCRKNESSAGYCLPGDPVPYLLYPPEITLTGLTAEVAVIIALAALFP